MDKNIDHFRKSRVMTKHISKQLEKYVGLKSIGTHIFAVILLCLKIYHICLYIKYQLTFTLNVVTLHYKLAF